MPKKPATIFDHIAGITHRKKSWDKLSEADQKSFSPYIINRWLSMHPDIIETIDLLQRYTIGPLSKKHVYQLYHDVLPEANVRAKYIKGKKVNKHNADLVKFVAEYYEISRKEAEERIDMYKHFSTGVESLTEMLQSYGKTEKEIKKLLK